jgi:hypothetical protein
MIDSYKFVCEFCGDSGYKVEVDGYPEFEEIWFLHMICVKCGGKEVKLVINDFENIRR